MKVSRLQLDHFRSARQLTIDLEPGINLLVGVNGAGKSTILDGLAILLSWAIARIRSSNARGQNIPDIDIHNEKHFSLLQIWCQSDIHTPSDISWRLTQLRKGRNPKPNDPLFGMTSLTKLNEWANNIRDQIGQNDAQVNLPLFVYYPVNRAVIDIPLRVRTTHTFGLLDAYDQSLISGANFRDFFEWYRNREDLENEQLRESGHLHEDPQLRAVRKAIKAFLPGFSDISVKRKPLHMEVVKNNEKLRVDQLSDGEKCVLAMIGDLARRLAIANPTREDPLQGEGIVLIDEIDLHLHPGWQRMIIPKLSKTFPNCQFILSTHSPQVFGECEAQCIRRLTVEPLHGIVSTVPDQALGLDSSEILEEQMEAKSRNEEITKKLANIFQSIDSEDFSKAKKQIQLLQKTTKGSIPEIVRAESLITMLEPSEGEQG